MRRASALPKGARCPIRGDRAASRGAILPVDGANDRAFRRCSFCPAQRSRDRAALQSAIGVGQTQTSRLPDPDRNLARPALSGPGRRRSGEASLRAVCRTGRARGQATAVRRSAGIRTGDHCQDGFLGILPHRGRLHQLGQDKRRARRSRARLWRRILGSLRARNYRPGPDPLRPAV